MRSFTILLQARTGKSFSRHFALLHHRQAGFSLTEAVAATAVLGILTTTGIPSMQRLLADQQTHTVASTLVAALNTARSEAIMRRSHAVLCPSHNGNDCIDGGSETAWENGYLLFADSNGDARRDSEEPVLLRFEVARGITVRSGRSRDHVAYLPSGFATGTNLTFTLCPASKKATPRAVIVSNTGRARISTRLSDGSRIECAQST